MTAKKPGSHKPLNFEAMQKGVEDAMRALPPADPPSGYENCIVDLAESYVLARFDRVRETTPCSERQLKAKLLRIKKQSKELLISLMTLEEPACDALWRSIVESDRLPRPPYLIPPGMTELHKGRPTVGEMMAYLQRFIHAASAPIIREDAVKKGKGPDANMLPRQIAKAAARDFHRLTGKPPDLSRNRHKFPHFLEAVFKALELPNSVADHAAEVVHWWNGPDRYGENEQLVGK